MYKDYSEQKTVVTTRRWVRHVCLMGWSGADNVVTEDVYRCSLVSWVHSRYYYFFFIIWHRNCSLLLYIVLYTRINVIYTENWNFKAVDFINHAYHYDVALIGNNYLKKIRIQVYFGKIWHFNTIMYVSNKFTIKYLWSVYYYK